MIKKGLILLLACLLVSPEVVQCVSITSEMQSTASTTVDRAVNSSTTEQTAVSSEAISSEQSISKGQETDTSQSTETKPDISDLQSVAKIVMTSQETLLYETEFLTSAVTVDSHKVFKVTGQRKIDGQLYYYVESGKTKGYLLKDTVTELKKVNQKQLLTALNEDVYYKGLDSSSGNLRQGKVYETDGYYQVNGVKYYALYQVDSNNKRSWLGYAKESDLQVLKMEKSDQKVTVKKSGNRYQNFFWKKKGTLDQGTVYQVKGIYRLGNGESYYSLYRLNKEKKEVWYGYANTKFFNQLKMVKKAQKVTVIRNYKRYQDFYWNSKGDTKKGQVYETTGYYTLGNGERYYSLYQVDKQGKKVWKGYTNVKNFRELSLKKQTKLVTVKKEYQRYQDFYWNPKGQCQTGQVYESRGYYELGNGNRYYTLYKKDKNGKAKWYGYANVNAFSDLKSTKIDKRAKVIKNYQRYQNFFWQVKGDLKGYQKKTVVVKYRYTLGNGNQYYSIYTTDNKWLGYVNAKAIKIYRYKKLNVPNYNQYVYQVPTGCEGTALLQALQYKGYVKKETPTTFLKKIPRSTSPYTGFAGNPFLPDQQAGFPAIFSKPLAKWGKKYGNVIDYSGKELTTAINEVMKGNPSVIYVTGGLKPVQWRSYSFGKAVVNNHAVTLAGYDEEKGKVYLSDSISGKYWVSYAKLKKIYDARKWTVTVRSK